MAVSLWITTSSDLGIISVGDYYTLTLAATNLSGGSISYSLISGALPLGLSLSSAGVISGYPYNAAQTGLKVSSNYFTVRVTSTTGTVADRTFNLRVSDSVAPVIYPATSNLGSYNDGSIYSLQLTAVAPDPNASLSFSIITGALPPGITLSSSGLLQGYFGLISGSTTTYSFSVSVTDGINSGVQPYTVTVNHVTTHSPIITNDAGIIAVIRQNVKFTYKFDAIDLDNSNLSFAITSGALPTGLSLNATTGWITGLVASGSQSNINHTFTVKVFKTSAPTYFMTRVFTITVIGEVEDTVNWTTDSALGSLYNGAISNLYIAATTPSGRTLTYSLANNNSGTLPYGLILLSNGLISGRVSFQLNNNVNLQTFTFTATATDVDGYVYDEKTFTIDVVKRTDDPYENLYIQLLPSITQRSYYDDIINNTDIINPDYVYRLSDPWFGKNTTRQCLFLTGLSPKSSDIYFNSLAFNHYWKTLRFGGVKTAKAVDSNFNTEYEVVYLEIIDQQVNDQNLGPNLSVKLPNNSLNISTIYPNSFPNMIERVTSTVGYESQSILPSWMTSRQDDGRVLGFTRALVLCYALPGRSAEIAYKVSKAISNFNLIDFTIERYGWDSVLSNNYEKNPFYGNGVIKTYSNSNVVVGTGTNFDTQFGFLPGKTIFVSNVPIGVINTVSNATVFTLTANATTTYASAIYRYSSNIFLTNNYVTGTGTISANTQSRILLGNVNTFTGTGTINGNTSSTTITGVGTAFTTELSAGKQLKFASNGVVIGNVASITNATSLTLTALPTYNLSNVQYSSISSTTTFINDLHVGDTIIAGNVVLGIVANIASNTFANLTANSLGNVSNISFTHTYRDPYTVPGQGDKYLIYPHYGILG